MTTPRSRESVDDSLVRGVDLLCLDAGNTVIFLDHLRLARLVWPEGLPGPEQLVVETLIAKEGEAKRLAETSELLELEWSFQGEPGARGWGRMVGTIAHLAGLARGGVAPLLERAWRAHCTKNLWCLVPLGLGPALDAVRALGVNVAIISNSEGMLERLFRELGIREHFDLIVDSGVVGVEKPDPRIFTFALERFGVPPERALHLGDVFATDIEGARAAKLRHALIDPFGHYEGRHLDVPRVPGAAEVAEAITRARRPA